jgi:hypothetical protein
MSNFNKILAGAAAIGAIATPAAAQYYPQPTYPQQTYPQQAYPGTGYGYQGTTGNPVTDVIDQLLGNRYSVTDRQAVRRCTNAVQAQALRQYGGGYGQQGYAQNYNQGYRQNIAAPSMRVTSITDVQRRNSGLRVRGTLSSGYAGQYGNQYGYQNRQYAGGDLSFRCNVDYRSGQVTDIRVDRGTSYRRY